jgi:hypothetical protein
MGFYAQQLRDLTDAEIDLVGELVCGLHAGSLSRPKGSGAA